jgi:hypothetical protein
MEAALEKVIAAEAVEENWTAETGILKAANRVFVT